MRVVADPALSRNTIRGRAGSITATFVSVLSPDNAKTAMLACYGAALARRSRALRYLTARAPGGCRRPVRDRISG